jgi:Domain of unknown function (DUF4390)
MRIGASLTRLVVALLCATALCATADEIDVVDARLAASEEGLLLSADFAFDFSPRLQEAVANGVPLHFVVEFELTRPRWWWFDEETATRRTTWRLSYHALTRQYRLSTGALHQNFATLDEALDVMRRLRNWQVLERSVSLGNASYEAAIRMRLDTAQLPRPLQLSALTSRELRLESSWKRFIFRPPTAAMPIAPPVPPVPSAVAPPPARGAPAPAPGAVDTPESQEAAPR